MARLPRLALAGHVHLLVQRGNNGQDVFMEAPDHRYFLGVLEKNAKAQQVAVHAYVLLPSQFMLLATPSTADGLSRLMQAIGRDYVRYFNARTRRTGTLWEGRYRSTIIQPDQYLLDSMAFVELGPVRADMVASAGDYPWSSHLHWTTGRPDPVLTSHAAYWRLGNTPFAREAAYAAHVRAGLSPARATMIDEAMFRGWVLGDMPFITSLQGLTSRRLTKATPGRPRAKSRSVPNNNAEQNMNG